MFYHEKLKYNLVLMFFFANFNGICMYLVASDAPHKASLFESASGLSGVLHHSRSLHDALPAPTNTVHVSMQSADGGTASEPSRSLGALARVNTEDEHRKRSSALLPGEQDGLLNPDDLQEDDNGKEERYAGSRNDELTSIADAFGQSPIVGVDRGGSSLFHGVRNVMQDMSPADTVKFLSSFSREQGRSGSGAFSPLGSTVLDCLPHVHDAEVIEKLYDIVETEYARNERIVLNHLKQKSPFSFIPVSILSFDELLTSMFRQIGLEDEKLRNVRIKHIVLYDKIINNSASDSIKQAFIKRILPLIFNIGSFTKKELDELEKQINHSLFSQIDEMNQTYQVADGNVRKEMTDRWLMVSDIVSLVMGYAGSDLSLATPKTKKRCVIA